MLDTPRVPRSMSRVRPPVWRSRWKRSDSACRWRNTLSAISRTVRCVTLAKTYSRNSVKTEVDKPQQAVADDQGHRHGQCAGGPRPPPRTGGRVRRLPGGGARACPRR